MLKDVDDAVAKGDAENVAAAVSIVREALHLTRRFDETADSTGVRPLFPIKLAK
jgi:hypothetical protein